MKKTIALGLFILASCVTKNKVMKVVEISCGQCQFDLESEKGCSLAVRLDKKAYFVDGFGIDDYGDAHDVNLGFCNVIRKAAVIGFVENGRFKASTIKLVE